MSSQEKLAQGLKLVIEAFAEMINENKVLSTPAGPAAGEMLNASNQTFNLRQASEYMQISHYRLYTLARTRGIKHFKTGSKYLFRKRFLDEWIEQELNGSVKIDEPQNEYGRLRKVKS